GDVGQLLDKPRLADAGGSDNRPEHGAGRPSRRQCARQGSDLLGPSDEAVDAARSLAALRSRPARSGPLIRSRRTHPPNVSLARPIPGNGPALITTDFHRSVTASKRP